MYSYGTPARRGMGSNGYYFNPNRNGLNGLGSSAYHAAGAVGRGAHPFDGLYYTAGAIASRPSTYSGYGSAPPEGSGISQADWDSMDFATQAKVMNAKAAADAKATADATAGAATIITASTGALANIIQALGFRKDVTQQQHADERAAAAAQERMLSAIRASGGQAPSVMGGGGLPGWLIPAAVVGGGALALWAFLRR